jgi:uncharacterized protein (TIGR02598 family)
MKSRMLIAGFSLVEVVLAIGIVSFALVAVVGLLPAGMKSIKNAKEQAAAVNVLNAIANALRCAEKNGNSFSNTFAGQNIVFTTNGGSSTVEWDRLDLNGQSTNSISARLKARLVITNPVNATSAGQALISIAWPAQAPNLNWTGSEWTNAQGQLSTRIQFLPGK